MQKLTTLSFVLWGCSNGGVTIDGVVQSNDSIEYLACNGTPPTLTTFGPTLNVGGAFGLNPYTPTSTAIDPTQYVTAGTELVSVIDAKGRAYITSVDHEYTKTCSVLWNNESSDQPCVTEIFELDPGWPSSGFNTQYQAKIYPMSEMSATGPLPPVLASSACAADAAVEIRSNLAWTSIGSLRRPSWVSKNAERRLRLVDELPAIQAAATTAITNYFGTSGPGLTDGIVLDDGLFYSHGYGFRDQAKTAAPDDTTVFCVGSLTKVYTGTALLAMIDNPSLATNGPRSLEDNVSNWVTPSFGAKLKHLVSHTSGGFPDQMNGTFGTPFLDESQWLTALSQLGAAPFVPGAFAAYSGDGVEAVGLIIGKTAVQRASPGSMLDERSYELFLANHIFTPLGMTSSTLRQPNVPANLLAQKYALNWTGGSNYSFAADSSYTPPEMLTPAGNVFTNIDDNAKFMQMWLAQKAPNDPVTHAPILSAAHLAGAQNPQITTASGPVPAGCGGFTANNAYYSECGDAQTWGVNWLIANRPAGCNAGAGCNFIEHEGSTGEWGSQTRLSIPAKMGTTVLMATNPNPIAPAGDTQPTNVSVSFINDVADTMLDNAIATDAHGSWWAQPLAVPIARVLLLSGAPTTDASTLTPHFTSSFLSALGSQSIATYVQTHLQAAGACDTFRVLGATTDHVTVRFHCATGQNDMTLYSDMSSYQIDRITSQAVTQQPF